MISSKMCMLILVAVLLAGTTTTTKAQQPPSCASTLVPCAQYLNSTNPPSSCCDPLKEAITKDLECLCNLYKNPSFLPSLGINVTQALLLPKNCKIPGDLSACSKAGAPSSSTPSSPSGTSPVTPAPKDKNGVSRIALSGMSSLLMLCASVMLA